MSDRRLQDLVTFYSILTLSKQELGARERSPVAAAAFNGSARRLLGVAWPLGIAHNDVDQVTGLYCRSTRNYPSAVL
jgi:hypothetical protein